MPQPQSVFYDFLGRTKKISPREKEEAEFLLYCYGCGLLEPSEILTQFQSGYRKSSRASKAERKKWLGDAKWKCLYSQDAYKVRMITLRLLASKVESGSLACKVFTMAGYGEPEANLYIKLVKTQYMKHYVKRAFSKLLDKTVSGDLVMSFERVRTECEEDFRTKKVWAACIAVARKKLSFISKYNNFDVTELASELLERAVCYYYWSRPFKSRLHAVNFAKASISGRALQLIRFYNSEDRRRLIETENGWASTVQSGYKELGEML
jgi:hypothetical protein